MIARTIMVGVTLLAVGFVLGRVSRRPDPELARRAAEWQRDTREEREAREAAEAYAERMEARADSLAVVSVALEQRARRAEARANVHRDHADTFRALLADAGSSADSLLACMGEVEHRRLECAALREEAASLDAALTAERQASVALRARGDTLANQVHRDAAVIARADTLVGDLLRAQRGCRWLVIPCGTGVVLYDPRDRALSAGVALPVTRWLTAGVAWRF